MTVAFDESIATSTAGRWEGAYEPELQLKCISLPRDREARVDTGPDNSGAWRNEGSEQFVKEIRFLCETLPMLKVESEILREEIGEYFKEVREHLLQSIHQHAGDSFLAQNSTLGTTASWSPESQAFYTLAAALGFARTRLMSRLSDFDAWLYLRRIHEGEEFEFEVPKRFVKFEEAGAEDWPDAQRVAVRRAARELLD